MTSNLSRFVLEVSKQVLLDMDGFLLPPHHPSWGSARPVPVTDLASFGSRLALLAPGAAGKTTTCRQLSELEGAEYVNAGALDRTDLRARIDQVTNVGAVAYLDGLDQAVLHDQTLLQWLAERLTTGEARSVQWRLASRPMPWERSLAGAGFTELRLLPIDRKSAEELVTNEGFDGPGFIRALVEARRGGLSSCVGQLLTEAFYWHKKGALPEHSEDALVHEIQVFLRETSPERRRTMPADRILRLAKRLGAFAAFSDAQGVSAAHTDADHTLRADELPSDPEPIEVHLSVEPDAYREVMDTKLFEAGPGATQFFRHQRYTDYLAAAYLVDREISAAQVPALLGVSESGVLPSARMGIAAWLGALAPDLIAPLVRLNALAFASESATIALQSDSVRLDIAESLLESARHDEPGTRWTLDLSGLAHPGLDAVLTRHLSNLHSADEVWWAARLANAGKCKGVTELLFAAAKDTKWPDYARRTAAVAFAALADNERRPSLLELLNHDGTHDPDNEILSTIVDALYPAQMSTTALLSALRPHRTAVIGHYLGLLHE